jgi:hypothetical protein
MGRRYQLDAANRRLRKFQSDLLRKGAFMRRYVQKGIRRNAQRRAEQTEATRRALRVMTSG